MQHFCGRFSATCGSAGISTSPSLLAKVTELVCFLRLVALLGGDPVPVAGYDAHHGLTGYINEDEYASKYIDQEFFFGDYEPDQAGFTVLVGNDLPFLPLNQDLTDPQACMNEIKIDGVGELSPTIESVEWKKHVRARSAKLYAEHLVFLTAVAQVYAHELAGEHDVPACGARVSRRVAAVVLPHCWAFSRQVPRLEEKTASCPRGRKA